MATLLFARTTLAACFLVALTPAAVSFDEAATHVPALALPPLPAVQLALFDTLTTASLGPILRPAPSKPDNVLDVPPALSQALLGYSSASLTRGDEWARNLPVGLWKTTAEWATLRLYPREAGYARILAFLAQHPDWPSNDWLRKRAEEALFGDTHTSDVIRANFVNASPRTPAGKIALARVFKQEGNIPATAQLVRDVWRNDDFNAIIERAVLDEFQGLLTKADHKFRADRLLYKEDTSNALRIAALAGSDVLALAKARSAVVHEAASDALIAAIPAPLSRDAGLIFSTIQKLRRADNFEAAIALMMAAPHDIATLVNGDEWWVERRLLARAALDTGDAQKAWRLCAEHSASGTNAQIEAEFHSGWIALRYLDNAVLARNHFAIMAGLAQSPASQAKAAYWQARTQEVLGDSNGASAFFAKAATQSSVYYGQLARARLGMAEFSTRSLPAAATGTARDEAIQVAELLQAEGVREVAGGLMYELARRLSDPGQMAALAMVAGQSRNAALSLQIGKQASARGMALDDLAFPDFGVPEFVPLSGSADKALVYSIVRQESAFVSKASSGAGAKGLMQLMVPTARKTAQTAGLGFDAERLTSDPSFNTQLGAAHLGTLFAEYDGSYILTFAAYNAGGGRVREWINAYGDPRKPHVDVVDWIEHIPITETRHYVQHVMENLQVYRARFGLQTTLLINADMRARGGRF